jgi:hypothetical protein
MRTKHDVIMHHYQTASPSDIIDTTTGKRSEKRHFSAVDTIENTHLDSDNALLDLDCPAGEQIYSNMPSITFKPSETASYPHTPAVFAIIC